MRHHAEVTEKILNVPGSADSVVLLDYMGGSNDFANLFRIREDGTEVWRAKPPGSGPNAWTSAHLEGDEVVAHSWSGFTVRLDLATGEELGRVFTK
jgi:outer membrane protein assembly factor BamB